MSHGDAEAPQLRRGRDVLASRIVHVPKGTVVDVRLETGG